MGKRRASARARRFIFKASFSGFAFWVFFLMVLYFFIGFYRVFLVLLRRIFSFWPFFLLGLFWGLFFIFRGF